LSRELVKPWARRSFDRLSSFDKLSSFDRLSSFDKLRMTKKKEGVVLFVMVSLSNHVRAVLRQALVLRQAQDDKKKRGWCGLSW
jgi:hypothetical protein